MKWSVWKMWVCVVWLNILEMQGSDLLRFSAEYCVKWKNFSFRQICERKERYMETSRSSSRQQFKKKKKHQNVFFSTYRKELDWLSKWAVDNTLSWCWCRAHDSCQLFTFLWLWGSVANYNWRFLENSKANFFWNIGIHMQCDMDGRLVELGLNNSYREVIELTFCSGR